jgi:hypothetical protein
MRSDAYIRVWCNDECGEELEIQLCATARRGYDERYVEDELERLGWLVVCDGEEYCPKCRGEHES